MLSKKWLRIIAKELEIAKDKQDILNLTDEGLYWLLTPISRIKLTKDERVVARRNIQATKQVDDLFLSLGFTIGSPFTYEKSPWVVKFSYMETTEGVWRELKINYGWKEVSKKRLLQMIVREKRKNNLS